MKRWWWSLTDDQRIAIAVVVMWCLLFACAVVFS